MLRKELYPYLLDGNWIKVSNYSSYRYMSNRLIYHVQLCDGRAVRRHVDDPMQHIPPPSTENLYLPDTHRRDTNPPAPPPPPPLRSTRNCPPPVRFGYDREHFLLTYV